MRCEVCGKNFSRMTPSWSKKPRKLVRCCKKCLDYIEEMKEGEEEQQAGR